MQYRDDDLDREETTAESFTAWVREQLELLADLPTSGEVEGSRPDQTATIM